MLRMASVSKLMLVTAFIEGRIIRDVATYTADVMTIKGGQVLVDKRSRLHTVKAL